MSMFDADAWLASVEKPSIRIDGKVHTGKLLSYEQFLPFATRLEQMGSTDNTKADTFASFAVDFLTAIFPKPLFRPWVVPHILQLPNVVEVVTHFLALQTGAMNIPSWKNQKTNGTKLAENQLPPNEEAPAA